MPALKFYRTLCLLFAVLFITACGGGDNNSYTSPYAGTTWTGTVGQPVGGTWTFTVEANAHFSGTVATPLGTYALSGGILDNGVLTSARAESSQGYAVIVGSVSGSTLTANWTGTWGATNLSSTTGTFNGSKSSAGSGSGGSCPWDPTAFYNEKQVASYNGNTYTAVRHVTPFGAAAATLFNPASDTYNWGHGGTCGPTPYITVESATCARGTSADVVTITGKALGGGIGDAIVAYTSVTDRDGTNENNFGLLGRGYSMTCSGGGFTSGAFTSTTTPSYSVCVKTQESSAPTSWTATQTIVHNASASLSNATAYASKGEPLRATVTDVGSIILGLGAERSTGMAITGDCQ